MNLMSQGLSMLIAAQVQAVGLIFAGWWIGDWLNQNYPMTWTWYAVTFPVAILAIAQFFYMLIRRVMKMGQKNGQSR